MKTQDDLLKLWNDLPETVRKVIELIHSFQVQAIIVGGPIRDYFLFKQFPKKDFDVEIRFKDPVSFKKNYPEIKIAISKQLNCQAKVHNYDVLSWDRDDFSLDLAPARKEIFIPGQVGHSNFTVDFLFNPSDDLAFRRRDFTINAMGVEYLGGGWESPQLRLADPYQGREHLSKKTLAPCSEDFFKDPLRLIRACRFLSNFDFKAESTLVDQFKLTDLSALTPAHFWAEYFKAKNLVAFLSLMHQYSSLATKNMPYPLSLANTLATLVKNNSAHDLAYYHNLPLLYSFLPREKRSSLQPFFLSHAGESPYEWQALEKFIQILENSPPPLFPGMSFEVFKQHPQLADIKFIASYFKKNLNFSLELKKYAEKINSSVINQKWWEWPKYEWTKKVVFPDTIQPTDRATYQLWSILTQ